MCKHCKKPLLQAGRGMHFASGNVRTSLISTNQEKRKKGTKEMIENRNVNIITDADGKKLVPFPFMTKMCLSDTISSMPVF